MVIRQPFCSAREEHLQVTSVKCLPQELESIRRDYEDLTKISVTMQDYLQSKTHNTISATKLTVKVSVKILPTSVRCFEIRGTEKGEWRPPSACISGQVSDNIIGDWTLLFCFIEPFARLSDFSLEEHIHCVTSETYSRAVLSWMSRWKLIP